MSKHTTSFNRLRSLTLLTLIFRSVVAGMFLIAGVTIVASGQSKIPEQKVIDIGSKRELFLDDYLVENITGKAELRLNKPAPRNIVLETSEPWEGNGTNYVTVFQDGPLYRMYYRACHYTYTNGKDRPNSKDIYCYAESTDGVNWKKPNLGIIEWKGSTNNNIILDSIGIHAFSPFRDSNPNCAADAKYKALGFGGGKHGLYAFKSADGIHWELMSKEPVITKGAFDSQNLAFWDSERKEYRGYHRDFRGKSDVDLINAATTEGRDIRTETSEDFINWTTPLFLDYNANNDPGKGKKQAAEKDIPKGRVSELYTNQITPYYRAPHLMIGFPTRYVDKGWTESATVLPRYDYRKIRANLSRREGTAITEGMLISSRDRQKFSVWPEAFLRPGLRNANTWFYGDMYQNWGLVETKSDIQDAPPEISLYASERTLQEQGALLRRYTIRIDGFVSLHSPLTGGELITKPFIFRGDSLLLNVSTSAAGSVRVEIQNGGGRVIPGFSLKDCEEIYGDDLERAVVWKNHPGLASLEGKPVRLRFVVRDADVYSFVFKK